MPSIPTAIHADDVPVRTGSTYPPPHDEACRQRRRRRLGDAFGLSQFGVNLLELPPGTWSSQRHWHQQEDEFVYVLEGEVTLISNEGETVLKPGMIAGFRGGETNAHHLINRSNALARVLEVGTRSTGETARYPDIDMMYRDDSGYTTPDGQLLK